MLTKVLILLFSIGVLVAFVTGLYVLSFLVFVFDTTIEDPSLMAELPKGLFFWNILLLLGFHPEVRDYLEHLDRN